MKLTINLKKEFSTKRIFSIPVFVVLVSILSSSIPDAHATTFTLDSTYCTGTILGTWNGLTNTCTISTGGYILATGDDLVIPVGTTLIIANVGHSDGLDNSGTITNFGTIIVKNTGGLFSSIGIFNGGTIINNAGGIINVQNTAPTGSGNGIENFGTITNNSGGVINVENTSTAVGITNFGTITNSGIINVCGTGSIIEETGGVFTGFKITNNCGLPVGGSIIPVDMTALFAAGVMTNAFWMVPTLGGVAGAAIALFKVKRKRE